MELQSLNIQEAINGLRNKQFSSLDITKACLEQINKYNNKIRAFILITKEQALKQAEEADAEIKKLGKDAWKKKPLLGIPYACKDNFSTKGITTTGSSKVLENYTPPFNATVVEKLENAGAILLGKTNMDAFAHGSTTETSDFFNTHNPWDTNRVPGGSSGGSAAAVAANMCIFAIGSETAGSVRGPASWCGVTGLKPTYGRVSRYGVIAMASSTDSPGPITKTVYDSALLLEVLAGKDQRDATSSEKEVLSYSSLLDKFDLKGIKIGKPRSYFNVDLDLEVKDKVEEGISKLQELGAEIIDMDLIDPKYSIAVYTILQRSEVSSNLARLDGIRYGNKRTEFGFEAKKRMMLGAYALSSGYYDAYYSKAQKVRTLLINDLKKAFQKVDVIVGPTMPCIAMPFGENDKSSMFGELMDVLVEQSSIAGICGLSVPCGFSKGLPVGINIMADLFNEEKAFGVSYVYQKNTNFHNKFPNLEDL